MNRPSIIIAVLALVLSGSAAGWSSFRSDPLNTGSAPFDPGRGILLLWEHKAGSPITTSAVADGGIVVYGTRDGAVECLNEMNGTLLWNHSTGSRLRSTPCIAGDVVVYCNDIGVVGALHAANGTPIWTDPPIGAEILSSPKVVDGRIYVGTYGSEFLCLDLSNGTVMWRYRGCTNWIHTTPSVWQGKVYFGSCDGTMNCLDTDTGKRIWTFNATFIPSSPSVMGGKLYFGAYDSTFYCLNASTGVKIFGTELGGDIYSSPAIGSSGAYVGCDDGKLYAIDPYNGNVLWTNTSSGGTLQSSPALAGDLVAFCDKEGIKIVQSDNGKQRMAFRYGDASDSSPALDDDRIIWGDSLGYIRAIGPQKPIDGDGGDGYDMMLVLSLSLAGLNLVFLAVVLISMRLLRKKYNRSRRLRLEKEFAGGR